MGEARAPPVVVGAPAGCVSAQSVAGAIGLALLLAGCSRPAPELGAADYAALRLPAACAPNERPGGGGATDRLRTSHGIAYSIRTPSNYDPTRAHPLLVVYAPAGRHRFASEAFYRLTGAATAAGFIVAHPDHVKPSLRAFDELGRIPALVAERWCVDRARIYLAGHSDGGTTAAALAFLGKSQPPPRGVAISAAGIRAQDLRDYACPPPLSVMVVHSRADALFPPPDYGEHAARWWAACNGCEAVAGARDDDGCAEYRGCAPGARTRYCEADNAHHQWPSVNRTIVRFFGTTEPGSRNSGAVLQKPGAAPPVVENSAAAPAASTVASGGRW
jgi:polyhydroxybutyrate depolymerase